MDINKKIGTVKEEVSKIIFCNFEWHCSLGSEVHLFIPLGVFFCFKTLRVCLNNQNILFDTFLTMAAVTLAFALAVWSSSEQQYIDVKQVWTLFIPLFVFN